MQTLPVNNVNCLNSLHNLKSVINPEKESCFEYLSTFLPFSRVIKFSPEELLKKERIYHDMILNPAQHKVTKIRAWLEYIAFVQKAFGREDLRNFLVLENFTKSSTQDKENFTQQEFVTLWMTYAEMCEDAIEVTKFMKKYNICTTLSFYYYATAIMFEKEHDFRAANSIFLEGLERNLVDPEVLQAQYTVFENRMEGRINREVKESIFSSEEINDYIQNEIRKKSEFNLTLGVKRPCDNIGTATSNNFSNILNNNLVKSSIFEGTNFCIKKKKIEYSSNPGINSIKYGEVPVYVDESFRKNVITKGTRFVEIYSILINFLLINKDRKFEISYEEFNKKLINDKKKLPSSWISGIRIHPEKILMPVNDSLNEKVKNKKDENKIEEVMNNMFNELNKKATPVDKSNKGCNNTVGNPSFDIQTAGRKLEANENNEKTEKNNKIDKIGKIENSALTGTTVSGGTDHNLKFNENVTCHEEEGRKYRIVKVESSKKESVLSLDLTKMLHETTKLYQPLSKIRADFYFKEKERKAKEAKEKNRRKTIVYKVDSDGDLLMSDEEQSNQKPGNKQVGELSKQPGNTTKENTTAITSNNNNPDCNAVYSNKVSFAGNLITQEGSKNTRNIKKVVDIGEHADKEKGKDSKSLNLFDMPMTIEQISDKMLQAQDMHQLGKIDSKTRDVLLEHLEQKIYQLEILEKEKKSQIKNTNTINQNPQSFSQINIISNLNQIAHNPFAKNETENELHKYINQQNNNPANYVANNVNITKVKAEDLFNKVSRSLDFSNVSILENPQLKPASLIFENKSKSSQIRTLPCDEVSISFDSEHSFLFQNKNNSLIKDEDYVDSITPNKDNSFNLHRAFNLKDTPQLIKKQQPGADLNKVNKNLNYNQAEKESPDFEFITKEKNKAKFTDFNNMFDSEDESEKERKMKLTNLFGEAFAVKKEPLNNPIPFGLSSITEKTTENTYISEDSFFLKKII